VRSKLILVATLLVAGCAAPPPGAEQQRAPIELAGRRPGPPQRCVPIIQGQALRISETNRHVLIYGYGKTVWANDLGSCRFVSDDILVTEPFGSSYCQGDIVRSLDRVSRIPGATCVLGEFVPYTR
jgi:hypothetical protein